MSVAPTALFDSPDQTTFIPTELSRGPWDPRHCHGGPTAALLTRAAEQVESNGVTWQLARLTIELTRPVPVGHLLNLTTVVDRPGRKVSLVSGRLSDDGIEVARFTALRVRSLEMEIPAGSNHDQSRLPSPELGVLSQPTRWETTSYYGPDGGGMAESALYDTTGRVGRSCQSLLVQPR